MITVKKEGLLQMINDILENTRMEILKYKNSTEIEDKIDELCTLF